MSRAASKGRYTGPRHVLTPEVAAEAAVWVARLHGPNRSGSLVKACLAWQARSQSHREAFERCTDTWQDVSGTTLINTGSQANAQEAAGMLRSGFARRWASAVALALVLGLAVPQLSPSEAVYTTDVGEQRSVRLADGTRMTLNTDTKVVTKLGTAERAVALDHGEALFEVAKESARPFIVHAGGSIIVARGTVFSVRFSADRPSGESKLSVVLTEGQIHVQNVPDASQRPSDAREMRPGERLQVVRPRGARKEPPARIDYPNVANALAWRRGEVVFDDATLTDAVAEMNRYSREPIVLQQSSALGELRVSGLYQTGDSAGFASAAAALHDLSLLHRDGRLELSSLAPSERR